MKHYQKIFENTSWSTSYFCLGCHDLWRSSVSKDVPVTLSLNTNYADFFSSNDLSELLKSNQIGQKYTLILKVSSTCSSDIKVGFSGVGGWFKKNVPANSNSAMITITDTWKDVPKTAFENRMTCTGKSITIHQIQLVKGSENCLTDGGKPFL